MKQEDIDRLREICTKNGFEVVWNQDSPFDSITISIVKKDPWEGVEFIRGNDTNTIRKVVSYDGEKFTYFLRDSGNEGCLYTFCKSNFKPSTEAEYVEQLKREAFEQFGEIKDGDKFQFYGNEFHSIKLSDNPDFDYFNEVDELSLWGFSLYKQGKWAKKLPERVEVEVKNRGWKNGSNGSYDFEFRFNVKNGGANTSMGDCSIFLASQLEKYLNNEINE